MAVVGDWNIYYDWGATGVYVQAKITFNNDGTFTQPSTPIVTGKWRQKDGMILFQYANKTTYGGNITGNAIVGMSFKEPGSAFDTGNWYAIRVGTIIEPPEEHKREFDAAGNKVKQ